VTDQDLIASRADLRPIGLQTCQHPHGVLICRLAELPHGGRAGGAFLRRPLLLRLSQGRQELLNEDDRQYVKLRARERFLVDAGTRLVWSLRVLDGTSWRLVRSERTLASGKGVEASPEMFVPLESGETYALTLGAYVEGMTIYSDFLASTAPQGPIRPLGWLYGRAEGDDLVDPDDSYLIERDDLWAIATSEIPLNSLYRDEIIDEADLPFRFMAYTPCFRREAGSAGRDTRGLRRVHEFDKVELFGVSTPEQAPGMLADFLARAEARLAELGLTYRLLEICTFVYC